MRIGHKLGEKRIIATEGRISRGRSKSISHGLTRINTESKHFFTSLKRKRRFLKEAKHFYREDAKTAKRQKGRSRSISHGRTRKNTESKHFFDLG